MTNKTMTETLPTLATPTDSLIDGFGRRITYLRLSVTDRCDFRCVYCMAEEMTFLPRAQLCTLEELASIGKAFIDLGVERIRITGGEPLIRRDVIHLFESLGSHLGQSALQELTLTTNGSRLTTYAQSLADAGVKRINVSLDSLQPDRFRALTRIGDLDTVLKGITAAQNAGIERIKLNAVILKNRNSDEVQDLVQFALENGLDISFIEEMPLGSISEHSRKEEFLSSEALRERIGERFDLSPIGVQTGGPSRYWGISGSNSRIGFISPHSENFCGSCNRVRVSAEGKLLLCLGNDHSADLKAIQRNHPGEPERLKSAIINAMSIKPERHHFSLSDDEPQVVRFMNATGG
ncbi:GTP 3',8-cyclase MoaA [Marinibactrum halimedae]|nr:GTP 3',8-cyclase MoaA [Marinibactrum halimedae]MCD9458712.1 GTP 3',8-cyclase MoaA [Marinibactrum halimedae]